MTEQLTSKSAFPKTSWQTFHKQLCEGLPPEKQPELDVLVVEALLGAWLDDANSTGQTAEQQFAMCVIELLASTIHARPDIRKKYGLSARTSKEIITEAAGQINRALVADSFGSSTADETLPLVMNTTPNVVARSHSMPKNRTANGVVSSPVNVKRSPATPVEQYTGDNWQDRSACRTEDPEMFFLEDKRGIELAKRVCRVCVVQKICLEGALERDEEHGTFGGLSSRERQALKRRQATRH